MNKPTLLLLLTASATAHANAVSPSAAMQHRCVLECVWARSHCASGSCGSFQMASCTASCMDRAMQKALLSARMPARWGETIADAIEVCLPSGQRYFLADLRCPSGEAPTFRRTGNVGGRNPGATIGSPQMSPTYKLKKGEKDQHTVDRYQVACGSTTHTLYFDMYHCGGLKPWAAPRGFSRPARR